MAHCFDPQQCICGLAVCVCGFEVPEPYEGTGITDAADSSHGGNHANTRSAAGTAASSSSINGGGAGPTKTRGCASEAVAACAREVAAAAATSEIGAQPSAKLGLARSSGAVEAGFFRQERRTAPDLPRQQLAALAAEVARLSRAEAVASKRKGKAGDSKGHGGGRGGGCRGGGRGGGGGSDGNSDASAAVGSTYRPPEPSELPAEEEELLAAYCEEELCRYVLEACAAGREDEVVRLLDDAELEVRELREITGPNGITPLIAAAAAGHTRLVGTLMARRPVTADDPAPLDEVDYDDHSALWWACARGHTASAALLLDAGASADPPPLPPPGTDGSWRAMLEVLGGPPIVYGQGAMLGVSPLAAAVAGVDDERPSHFSSWNGHEGIVTLLLDRATGDGTGTGTGTGTGSSSRSGSGSGSGSGRGAAAARSASRARPAAAAASAVAAPPPPTTTAAVLRTQVGPGLVEQAEAIGEDDIAHALRLYLAGQWGVSTPTAATAQAPMKPSASGPAAHEVLPAADPAVEARRASLAASSTLGGAFGAGAAAAIASVTPAAFSPGGASTADAPTAAEGAPAEHIDDRGCDEKGFPVWQRFPQWIAAGFGGPVGNPELVTDEKVLELAKEAKAKYGATVSCAGAGGRGKAAGRGGGKKRFFYEKDEEVEAKPALLDPDYRPPDGPRSRRGVERYQGVDFKEPKGGEGKWQKAV